MKLYFHRYWVWLLFLLLFLAGPRPAAAHGGGAPQIVNAPAGPYLVSAWTDPDPLRVGTAHVTVALSEPATDSAADRAIAGEAVLGAAVRVVLEPQAIPDVRPVGGLATHENAINRLFYEADLELPASGIWRVKLLIDGPAGTGETEFDIQVLPPTRLNWTILVAAAAVVIIAAIVVQLTGRARSQRDEHRTQIHADEH